LGPVGYGNLNRAWGWAHKGEGERQVTDLGLGERNEREGTLDGDTAQTPAQTSGNLL
jgi:hypothetical protein